MSSFRIDHDLHIHSRLSSCSSDPEQTTARILQYARDVGLSDVCLTDHFWDSTVPGASSWYAPQNEAHLREALPLPQAEGVRFHFGCETDMDRFFTLGISRETIDRFDFVIVPTTHLHMTGFTIAPEDDAPERRAALYVRRLDALLDMDLPFNKIGIAHLTTRLIYRPDVPGVLDLIPDAEFGRLFARIASVGAGVEINMNINAYADEIKPRILRPYRIARECGCKFYLGSDAHHPGSFDHITDTFRANVEAIGLEEEDEFRPFDEK